MIPLRDVIPSRTTPGVTITLIVLNVAIYLLQLLLADQDRDVPDQVRPGAGVFLDAERVHAMFVHGGLAHLGATCCSCGSSATTSRIASATAASSRST
jgi:membrane associated rhomboid family serine protease